MLINSEKVKFDRSFYYTLNLTHVYCYSKRSRVTKRNELDLPIIRGLDLDDFPAETDPYTYTFSVKTLPSRTRPC